MPALGDGFREAREARGLSLSDVAEQIHIRSVYLAAIENEDWAAIGAPVYIRGFLRTYARYLGLDGEGIVQRFNETPAATGLAPAATMPSASSAEPDERRGLSPWVTLAGIVALVLVAFVGYEYWLMRSGNEGGAVAVTGAAQPAASAAPSAPAPEATAAPSPSPSPSASPSTAARGLAIHLVERSWLRVVVDGTTAMEGLFPAGTVRTFTGHAALVRAGNAGGVHIAVNGRDEGALGAPGDVVERSYTLGG